MIDLFAEEASPVTAPSPAFEQRPRWPGAPLICLVENLPAFETLRDLDAYHQRYSPSCSVIRRWQCEHCHYFHEEGNAPAPSGGSSGTGRQNHQSLFS